MDGKCAGHHSRPGDWKQTTKLTGVTSSSKIDPQQMLRDIRTARREYRLPYRFLPRQLATVCPGPSAAEYTRFLYQHRVGNEHGKVAYFWRRGDKSYSLIGDNWQ